MARSSTSRRSSQRSPASGSGLGDVAETGLWPVGVTVSAAAALWSGRRLSWVEGALLALSEPARRVLGHLRMFG